MLIEFVSKTADGRTAPLGAKRRGEGGKEYPALFISLLLAALSFSFSTRFARDALSFPFLSFPFLSRHSILGLLVAMVVKRA